MFPMECKENNTLLYISGVDVFEPLYLDINNSNQYLEDYC